MATNEKFKTYCLATMDPKCDNCQHQANWEALNQLPDALRKSLQANMHRVRESACQFNDGEYTFYESKENPPEPST
jgi:hypothetical protein